MLRWCCVCFEHKSFVEGIWEPYLEVKYETQYHTIESVLPFPKSAVGFQKSKLFVLSANCVCDENQNIQLQLTSHMLYHSLVVASVKKF